MKACCAPLEGKGRSCDNPSYYEELLAAAGQSAAAAAAKAFGSETSSSSSAPHRRLRNLLASGGTAAEARGTGETAETCAGRAEVGIGGCPPGKRPAVSVTALHEVHGKLFFPSFFFSGSRFFSSSKKLTLPPPYSFDVEP